MILEYIKTSLLMIKVKPVRSILSLLGIYIGVLALLVILSIREGVEYELQNLFRTEGAKVIYVHAGFDQETRRIGQLTFDDSKRLRSLDGILSVLPRLTGSKDARSEFASKRVDLVGIDEAFFPVYRIP
jgi:ABC-type lipoprotein release transport system permease subunit